jgi:eukaryotic-like serine/threonine-protein kinase
MSASPGMRLGPYEIVARLGVGGMGEVYRARDTRLGRTVAIKILPSAFSNEPERQERFRREARAISQLSHPHVCALYDVGQHDGLDYFVMEYLEGDTLEYRLRRGPLPLGLLLQVATDIADALAWSHRQGIAHRDLKPSNIILTATGAKLLDFGIAAFVTTQDLVLRSECATRSVTLTTPGTVLGTVQYMSPEQVEGKPGDFRSDIFALGILLYEMATGKSPFRGDTSAAIIAAVLKSDPPPIEGSAPAALERLVQACLAKDPNQRWQSAQDVKIELKWIERSQAEAPQRERRWRSWGMVTIAALALVLASLGAIFWGFPRRIPVMPAARLRSSLLPPLGTSYEAYGFALSPDGTRLASVAVSSEGQTSLYVRSLSSLATQAFPSTAGASYPFWSPDNRRIGFFAEGHLKYVDITSGNVQIIAEAPQGLGGTWNQDDVIVFARGIAGPLLRVSAFGGPANPVTTISGTGGHRWPCFLPDGRQFLYCEDRRTANNPRGNGIFLGSLDGSRTRLISQDLPCDTEYAAGHLFYVSDRNLMAQPFDPKRGTSGTAVPIIEQEIETDPAFGRSGFTTATNGEVVFQAATDVASRLVWFDTEGKPLGRISETGLKDPRLSSDGHRLVVTSDDAHNGSHFIRVYDLPRGVSTRITDSGQEQFPSWSPDGKSIVYMGRHGASACLCRVPADASSGPITLLEGAVMPNDWRGRWIAYMDFEKGFPSVWAYDVDTGDRRQIGEGAEAQFSPDGKWIAFVYGLPGNAQVYVRAFPGPSPRIQVSSRGGGQAQWSPDGRRLYYMAPDRKLMVVELQLRNGEAKASAPRVLFQTRITAPYIALFQYAVSPDGRFLINSLPTESPGPLTLLMNALTNQ